MFMAALKKPRVALELLLDHRANFTVAIKMGDGIIHALAGSEVQLSEEYIQ